MTAKELLGRTLGKYRLAEQLGQGGMAEVYKAYQSNLDRYVAVKVLRPFLAKDQDFLARFQREAKLIASMRHPNIVQVYDFDVEDNIYYMVTEFIDGKTLQAHLQKLEERHEWVSIDETVRIIAAIGSALKYAHGLGMVHRDVKPANIMLDQKGNVILTDFGIAKIMVGNAQTLTATGTTMGTPAYMSPEQGMGRSGDERSDIYSLGIILYQLTTGRLPFDADTPLAIIFKHIESPLPMPRRVNPNVPEPIERVILKALVKNPGQRYQHVGEMLDDLALAAKEIAGLPTPAGGPTPRSPIAVRKTTGQGVLTSAVPLSPSLDGTFQCPDCGKGPLKDDKDGTLTCPHCNSKFAHPERVCPRCETINELSARQCVTCGQVLKKVCPQCQTINWVDATLCRQCGASLTVLDQIAARNAESNAEHIQRRQSGMAAIKVETQRASQERLAKMWDQEHQRLETIARNKAKQRRQELVIWLLVAAIILAAIIFVIAFDIAPQLRLF